MTNNERTKIDPRRIEIIPPRNNERKGSEADLQKEMLLVLAAIAQKDSRILRKAGYTLAGLFVFAIIYSLITSYHISQTMQRERQIVQKLCALKKQKGTSKEKDLKIRLQNGGVISCGFKKKHKSKG